MSEKGEWKFTKGTLTAHAVINEAEGTTVCGRKDLKFEAGAYLIPESYKCKTCSKGVKKTEPKEPWRNPDTFASQYEDEAAKGADRY